MPAAGLDARGRELLALVMQRLSVDERLCQWHDDGFTWWISDFAQRFRVGQPGATAEAPTTHVAGADGTAEAGLRRLSVTTDYLRGVVHSEGNIRALIDSGHVTGAMTNITRQDDRLILRACAAVTRENEDQQVAVVVAAAMAAHIVFGRFAAKYASALLRQDERLAGIAPDISHHPVTGQRTWWHPQDDAFHAIFRAQGERPLEGEQRPKLATLTERLRADDRRVSFQEASDVLTVSGERSGWDYELNLNIRRRHPAVGHGLYVDLKLFPPPTFPEPVSGELLSELDELGWRHKVTALHTGGWLYYPAPFRTVVDPSTSQETRLPVKRTMLLYPGFYPNAAVRPGLEVTAAQDGLARMEWAVDWLEAGRSAPQPREWATP